MKTYKINTIKIVWIFFFVICITKIAKSQPVSIPYQFANYTSCSVKLTWTAYTYNACPTVCDAGTVSIAAGQSAFIFVLNTCSPPNDTQACNISITIIDIGGTAVSIGPFDSTSRATNPNAISGGAPGCISSTGWVDWDYIIFGINP